MEKMAIGVNSRGGLPMKMRFLLFVGLSIFASPALADDADVVLALQQLEEAQQYHLRVLTDLLATVPDAAKPAIQHAIESSQKGIEHSRAALEKAHGKPREHGKPDGIGGKPEHAGPPEGRGQGKPEGIGGPKRGGKPEGVGGKPAKVGKGKPQRGGPNR
jgi:hypothetical protein